MATWPFVEEKLVAPDCVENPRVAIQLEVKRLVLSPIGR